MLRPSAPGVSSSVEGISISTIGSRLQPCCARVVIGAVHVGEARRHDDAGGVVVASSRPGRAVKLGSSDSATFMRKVPEPHFQRCMRSRKSARQRRRRGTSRSNSSLRIDVGRRPRARGSRVPSVQHDAARRGPSRRSPRAPPAPVSISTPCSRAAFAIAWVIAPMPPMAWPQTPFLPFTSPKHMVQQHIGRARRIGAGIVADDGVEAEHRLDRIALEPAVEIVAGRLGEQVEQRALALHVEPRSRLPTSAQPCSSSRQRRASSRPRPDWAAPAARGRAARRRRRSSSSLDRRRSARASCALNFAISPSVRPSPVSR